ncbi:MAG: hypothetical protein JNL19_07640 [Burkholderiales bacterium]|nr:hypothetical protein [Burkholderiales bacterium]
MNLLRSRLVVCRALVLTALGVVVSAALAAPGDLDASFNASGAAPGYVLAKVGRSQFQADEATQVARQSDGKLVQVGTCRGVFVLRACAARFNADGSVDATFNANATQNGTQPDLQPGELIVDSGVGGDQMYGVAVQVLASGRILIAATCGNPTTGFSDFCVIAVTATGELDTTFNAGGPFPGLTRVTPAAFYNNARHMIVQTDGKIVVVGACGEQIINRTACVVRFNANGTLDGGFNAAGVLPGVRVQPIGSGGDSDATAAAEQTDGKLVVGAACTDGGQRKMCVFRVTAAGALDQASFATGTSGLRVLAFSNDEHTVAGLRIDGAGRLVLAGGCAAIDNLFVVTTAFCVARLLPDGALDGGGFNASAPVAERGRVRFNIDSSHDAAAALMLAPGGKIAVAGVCRYDQGLGTGVICLAQLNADGSFDAAFGNGGKAIQPTLTNQRDLAQHALLQPDGKWIVSARCFRGAPDVFCLARFDGLSAAASCALNVDGNAVLDASSDGLLIVRYLLGLRGSALTVGAIGSGATRSGAALESYLASLNLDADGDGSNPARATSDGLLIVRALLGLSGPALTGGAINSAVSGVRDAVAVRNWITTTHGASCLP